nr:hypothetical protein [Bacteroidota bacterium]
MTEDELLLMSKKELWALVKEMAIPDHKWTERKIDFIDAVLDAQEVDEEEEEVDEEEEEEVEEVIEAEPEPEVVDLKTIMAEKAQKAREPVMKKLPPSRKEIARRKLAPVADTGTLAHKKRAGARQPPVPQYVDKAIGRKRIRWGG